MSFECNFTSTLLHYNTTAGICRLSCCRELPSTLRYEKFSPSETYGDARRLSSLSSGDMIHHKRQRRWQWRLQRIFCWMKLENNQQTAFADVSSTLADAFTYFRGYVPTDIVAGIALLTMKESKGKVLCVLMSITL